MTYLSENFMALLWPAAGQQVYCFPPVALEARQALVWLLHAAAAQAYFPPLLAAQPGGSAADWPRCRSWPEDWAIPR